jgi:hypothetical protein
MGSFRGGLGRPQGSYDTGRVLVMKNGVSLGVETAGGTGGAGMEAGWEMLVAEVGTGDSEECWSTSVN